MLLNRERADRYLEEFGIDAVVSSSRENTTYLTNFLSVNFVHNRMYNGMPGSGENFVQAYGLYSRKGKNSLILPSALFMIMKTDRTVTKEVFTYGKSISLIDDSPRFETKMERDLEKYSMDSSRQFDSPSLALAAAVKESISGNRIGVDMSDMHPSSVKELKKLGMRAKNATELFRFIRMVKSDEEIARLKRAAEINERAMDNIFHIAKPGLSEKYLARAYSLSVVSESATYDTAMCPIGTKGGTMISPTDSKLTRGSMFWVDVACKYEGYYADTGESASMGPPSNKQAGYYSALSKVVEKAEDVVAPGMKPSELNSEIIKVWESAGVPISPTGMGHGIGLEVYDYPRISAAKGTAVQNQSAIKDDFIESSIDIPFEEGMVLNFEAPYLIRGWGGVHIEKTLILGKRKYRPLAKQTRQLRILG